MKKILLNALYYGGERVLYLILGLITNGLIARSLSLNEFGVLNTAYSIVGFFGFLFSMGVEYNLVKFLNCKNNNSIYLYSGIILRLIGSIIGVISVSIVCYFFYDQEIFIPSVLIAISGLFNALSLMDCVFQANENGLASFKSKFISRLICFAFQLLLYFYSPTINGFAVSSIVMNISLILLQYISVRHYIRLNIEFIDKLRVKNSIKLLYKESWPLALSGIAVTVFLQSDVIIISKLMNPESVALYSAITKILIPASFIPYAITQAFYPAFLKVRENKSDLVFIFEKLNMTLILIAYFFLGVSFLFTKEIILIAYGDKFLPSIHLFQLLSFTIIFTFLGAASSKILIVEGQQGHELYKSIFAAIVNVVLNILFIPKYGLNGAAYASIFALIIANFLYFLIIPRIRFIFISQIKSLVFIPFVKVIIK